MRTTPSPSYSITLRLEIVNLVGIFGKIGTAIGEVGGDIGAVDIVRVGKGVIVRDITVNARDEVHEKNIIDAVKKIKGVRVIHVSDRTFLLHHGGKIEIHNKVPVKNRTDLSRVYTPGVARVCMAIHRDKEKAYRFTIKRNSVAIVTDGSAVLGLGDIGPEAAMPVMEGKAMLFKEFANIDAFPICLSTRDTEEIIKTIKYISPAFGGINLEDISAPRCFEIEERLKQELDIPVFHDDQHGTAVVILAALFNAVKVVEKQLEMLKIVISGAGAAGTACCKILKEVGITDIIVCDREGTIYRYRKGHMNPVKMWLSENTNPRVIEGSLPDAMEGADVFIGVSAPNLITVDDIKKMATDPVVFVLANPEPEIAPEDAYPYVRILATGRSDYPNQINNMLCFPGLFRGLLDSRAGIVNEDVKLAAAKAIASMVDEKELSEDYIMPSIFDRKVVITVASAVSDAAYKTGVARRER
ncbi:MAG: malate dehydrogenase [Thermodesulfovibrio sp. RBG_19FT_COMBO_42_12]|nr:MAG: malate dehydrogenase [Thermodesulfovibrio sp. RBG_19FT_COMBO_42_12]